jgi:photosystem II stability/assembly factor-like uncharacterized protein
VHFSDALHGYAAGAFGVLIKTMDGGLTWTEVPTPVNFSFVSVWSRSPDEALVGRVGLYGTADGGATWEVDIGGFEAFAASVFDIVFTSPDTGFFTKGGDVFRSDDGGATWDRVGGSGQFLDDFHYAGGQSIYATGGITYIDIFGSVSRGEMERSRDGGLTWEPVVLDGVNEIHAAAWKSESEGFLFTFTNMAHHTADGGDTWSLLADTMTDANGSPLPAIVTAALVDPDGRFVAVDFAGNFLESGDAVTWTVTPGSGEPFSALAALADGTLVAVGNGGQVWRSAPAVAKRTPAITGIALVDDAGGSSLRIDATGNPGASYRLTGSPSLATGTWKQEGEPLTPATEEFSFTIPRPGGPEWYFRVGEVEPRGE